VARIAIAVYLAGLFALNVFRAATQSFTTDEVYTYTLFVGVEPFNLLSSYSANLHFLHTLATWVTVHMFGLSEFSYRLPSLLGCALYFSAVYRIAKQISPIAALLLTAHPLLQDNMSVGRGYGLALAFFAWAFSETITETPRLTRIAMLLALSIATNLTMLFPVSALIAVLVLQRRSLLLADLTGPFVVLSTLLLSVPLSRVVPGSFYFGAATIPASLKSLSEYPTDSPLLPLTAITAAAALIFLGCCATAFWNHRFRSNEFAFVSTATLSLTTVAVFASHFGFGILYPYARTGLYFLFLVPLCLLPLAKSKPIVIALAAFALHALLRTDPRIYSEWNFDASAKDIIRAIEQQHKPSDPVVTLSVSAPMATTLEQYRKLRGLTWIKPIESDQWKPGFDYYIMRSGDFKKIESLNLKETPWKLVPYVKVATP
jgi:hypothetical protein